MKRKTLLLALLGPLALSTACSQEPEPDQAAQAPPAAETAPAMQITHQVNPLTGTDTPIVRIQQLPSDAFFQEHNYPGSKVLDVKEIFGTPTVWLTSTDDYDKIDAFYKKKFTAADGSLQGRTGSYYRMTKDNRMQKASFTKKPGGTCDIVLTM